MNKLVIIFLIALPLRLVGVRWGIPYPYGHDGFFIISHAIKFFSGNLNPGWFIYPSFHMYFLFFIYNFIYWIGHIFGYFNSIQEFVSLLDTDPSIFIITGRVVASLLSSGSVVLCYILAKRLFSLKAACLVLLLTILPMEVLNAHYTTTDIPLVFWFTLAFIFCVEIMRKPDLRYYILAGIFTGIAGGTKYPGLGACMPILVAHLIRLYNNLGGKWKKILLSGQHYRLVTALVVAGVTFFISTPYVFLDYRHSIPNLAGEFCIRFTDTFDIYQRPNEREPLVYVKGAFLNFGFIFTTLGVLGTILRIRKMKREDLLLLSWIIPFGIIIHISSLKPPRYFLLLSPFLVIFFADVIVELIKSLEKFLPSRYIRYIYIFILLSVPLEPIYQSIRNDIILLKPDTRQQAHDWIIKNIPEGTIIAKELLWTPFLPRNRFRVIYNGWSLGEHDMEWYKQRNVEYLLVSEYMKKLLSHPERPAPSHRKFYRKLEAEGELIYRVTPLAKGRFMDFHNPTVLIYKIKDRS